MINRFFESIRKSGLSIYDHIDVSDSERFIPTKDLEMMLADYLIGKSLSGLPLRTRSKVVKEHVCNALGYPVPSSFRKTQPRFVGQALDIYIQKSNNLQIWNEEISSDRRYAILHVNDVDTIDKVKVLVGNDLAKYDSTGTLTQKFQARLIARDDCTELISKSDTNLLRDVVTTGATIDRSSSPIDFPQSSSLLPISELFDRLKSILGISIVNSGYDQERNRGNELHRKVCETLGYSSFRDDGSFPDLRHQLLEVKLQTSPTIDLGLVCPNSVETLSLPLINGKRVRHCDVRYVIFYALSDGTNITLTKMYLTTGENFFSRFPQFQGKVINKKLQIPLPPNFFEV